MNATRRTKWLAVGLLAGLLQACGSTLPAQRGEAPAGRSLSSASQQVVSTALDQLGDPYRYGARGPDAFDCSGLVYFAYRSAGLSAPRTSQAQYRASQPLSLDSARPGDLLFFSFTGKVSHVGIYLGDGRFVHAPSSGRPVTIDTLSDGHYRSHFVGAGRLKAAL